MCKYCNNDYENGIASKPFVSKKIKLAEVGVLFDMSILYENELTVTSLDDVMHTLLCKKNKILPYVR